MFEVQIAALIKSIKEAKKISNPGAAIDAYSDIIEEKLYNGKKTYTVAAILFLEDNDMRADVYYRRACQYVKLATKCTSVAEALENYHDASADLTEALDTYEDFDKRNDCRIKIKEVKEAISTIHQKRVVTPEFENKRPIDETSSDTVSVASPYRLRNFRMWTNPKEKHEERIEQLEEVRLHSNKKTKFS